MNAQLTSKSQEHYTPAPIIEAARALMGSIDLDPASSITANEVVRASAYFHKSFDGLNQPWFGNVWLNPPGGPSPKHLQHISKSYAALWWGKLVSEWEAGRVQQAVFLGFTLELLQSIQLLNVAHPLQFPLCIPKRRIRFLNEDLVEGTQPTHSNFIVWLPPFTGLPRHRFAQHFSQFGICT